MSQQLCAAPKAFQNVVFILGIDALILLTWTKPDPCAPQVPLFFRKGVRTGYHNTGPNQGVKVFHNTGLPLFTKHSAADGWKRIMEVRKFVPLGSCVWWFCLKGHYVIQTKKRNIYIFNQGINTEI